MESPLPEDAQERKEYPMYRGLLRYFPKALAAVSNRSHEGGKQHGHDELHWDRNKSSDDADALIRHVTEGDWVGAAWRALACLEKHLEGQDLSVLNQTPNGVNPENCAKEPASEWGEWIDWEGGEQPVASDVRVEVERRDGGKDDRESAYFWNWSHMSRDSDIIRYRVKNG